MFIAYCKKNWPSLVLTVTAVLGWLKLILLYNHNHNLFWVVLPAVIALPIIIFYLVRHISRDDSAKNYGAIVAVAASVWIAVALIS